MASAELSTGAFFIFRKERPMLSLPDKASMMAALQLDLDAQLHRLLADRIDDAEATGLIDLTHFIILTKGDTDGDVDREIGMSLLCNPLDGACFSSPSFQPHWDWLEDHGGWHEMIVTVGNSGFAFVIFIRDTADPCLVGLCRTYAGDGQPAGETGKVR